MTVNAADAQDAENILGDSLDDLRTDLKLLEALQGSDPDACERFVREHSPRALQAARRLLRSEADAMEAVQDAFLSFFRALPSFRGTAQLSTWLHRIVVNAARMKRRAKSRRPEKPIDSLLPRYYADKHRIEPRFASSATVAELAASAEMCKLVRKKIVELPDEYCHVVMLRDIEQLDTAEVARNLGSTPGAVKTRLHRARQALRTLLERELGSCSAI